MPLPEHGAVHIDQISKAMEALGLIAADQVKRIDIGVEEISITVAEFDTPIPGIHRTTTHTYPIGVF